MLIFSTRERTHTHTHRSSAASHRKLRDTHDLINAVYSRRRDHSARRLQFVKTPFTVRPASQSHRNCACTFVSFRVRTAVSELHISDRGRYGGSTRARDRIHLQLINRYTRSRVHRRTVRRTGECVCVTHSHCAFAFALNCISTTNTALGINMVLRSKVCGIRSVPGKTCAFLRERLHQRPLTAANDDIFFAVKTVFFSAAVANKYCARRVYAHNTVMNKPDTCACAFGYTGGAVPVVPIEIIGID